MVMPADTVWKKYQVFSKAADKYLQQLRQSLEQN